MKALDKMYSPTESFSLTPMLSDSVHTCLTKLPIPARPRLHGGEILLPFHPTSELLRVHHLLRC
jgi:hypothetical protein